MSSGPILGIDLGTTNSVVALADGESVSAIPDADGNLLTPSAVSFHPSGQVLVGRAARDRRMVDAPNTIVSVKRLIGRPFHSPEVRRAAERLPFSLIEAGTGGVMVSARGETYSLPEISAFVLRRLKRVADAALQRECTEAVITVPANFNELQRTATRDAGRIAGLQVRRILNEPTAAALAYGYGGKSSQRVAVYDLGGGTFDVSILDMSQDVIEVVGTAGDSYLGGDDVDSLIVERMAHAFLQQTRVDLMTDSQAQARLRIAAEWLKCRLSIRDRASVTVDEIAYADRGRPLTLNFELTRSELEQICSPLFSRTFDICEQAMKVAGVRPAQLDAVILVGGQTRTPQVRRLVGEYFGRPPLTNVDPDQVVAQGAALQALALSTSTPRIALGTNAYKRTESLADVALGFEDAPTRVKSRSEYPLLNADGAQSANEHAATHHHEAPVARRTSAPPPAMPPPVPERRRSQSFAQPELPPLRPPLLLDVTPLTLAIETAGGFCEPVIARNSAIPTEQTRSFSTSQDNQSEVVMHVCQGESRVMQENQPLGTLRLMHLPAGARGDVCIAVTFILDADGMLQAQARDLETGHAQQIRVNLVGAFSDQEIEQLRARQEAQTKDKLG